MSNNNIINFKISFHDEIIEGVLKNNSFIFYDYDNEITVIPENPYSKKENDDAYYDFEQIRSILEFEEAEIKEYLLKGNKENTIVLDTIDGGEWSEDIILTIIGD